MALAAAWLAMAVAIGSAAAFFLWSLDRVTALRFAHPWLLYLLPLAGLSVGLIYHRWGRSAEGGTHLLMDEIHEPGGGVPRRMAPLILLGTLVTHLCGGSAGREGTAVQMGGSIAAAFARWFRLDRAQLRLLLMAGIAAGFGAVFGTPIAGAVFAIEVLTVGRMEYKALLPCFIAALAADFTCRAWGIAHTHYDVVFHADAASPWQAFDIFLLGKIALAATAFGLASRLFAITTHRIGAAFKRAIPYAPLRPLIGGVCVIGLFFIAGTPDYLGLGVWSPLPHATTLQTCFTSHDVSAWSWLWKLAFTAVTLGSSFKGGEVTPLFFIGAALGNTLAHLLGAPIDLFAALGLVAIFAGATKTPFACTLMGIELFGATHSIHLALACFIAFLVSGKTGIYPSQRSAKPLHSKD